MQGSNDNAGSAAAGLRRLAKNLGWVLGGKGFAAICSLVYLAIMSRSLGIRDFGHFSLIFGTAQALVAMVSFQTWQTIVRFGVSRRVTGDWAGFGRLAWLGISIDVTAAALGCVVSAVIFFGFAETLGLNPEYVPMAFWFSCALLWGRMTTPQGVVRALDRFDLGSYVEAISPAGRLIAATLIALTQPSVLAFLVAWAAIDLLVAAIYIWTAWRLAPQSLSRSNFGHWRKTVQENPGIRAFFGVTYSSSTLDAIYKQGPLLAVGYLLGTSAAGLYRLADQLAQGIGKLSQLLTRAVFPEFALARAASSVRDFRRLVTKVTAMAAVAGISVTLVALLLGEEVLLLVGGDQYIAGAAILVPIAIGASFELAAVSYEPLLFSTGHAGYALVARTLAVLALAIGIAAFLGAGAVGVGWAVALGLAIFYAVMSGMVWLVLPREKRAA